MTTENTSRTSAWKHTAKTAWKNTTTVLLPIIACVTAWIAATGLASLLIPDKPVIATIIGNVFVIIVLGIHYTHRSRSEEDNYIRSQTVGTDVIAVTLVSTLCWWVSVQIFTILVNKSLDSKGYDEFNKAISEAPFVAVLALVLIVAPLTEEILFRGVAYRLLSTIMTIPAAIIISAALFGAIHGNAIQMIGAIPLGVTTAMVYEITRKLRLSIITHMFFNATSVVMPIPVILSVVANPVFAWPVIVISAVGGAAGWVFLAAKMPSVRQRYTHIESTKNTGQATISPETPDKEQ